MEVRERIKGNTGYRVVRKQISLERECRLYVEKKFC